MEKIHERQIFLKNTQIFYKAMVHFFGKMKQFFFEKLLRNVNKN